MHRQCMYFNTGLVQKQHATNYTGVKSRYYKIVIKEAPSTAHFYAVNQKIGKFLPLEIT